MFKERLDDRDYTTEASSDDETEHKANRRGAWSNYEVSKKILPRPNASTGYWLSCLLPLALCTNYLHHHNNDNSTCTSSTYKTLTIAAVGMCVESLCFYIYIYIDSWLFLKLFVSLVPSLFTSVLFKYVLAISWGYGLLFGFAITFCYQNVYVRVMRGLPQCFTYGEAAILIQGLVLFTLNAVIKLGVHLLGGKAVQNDFTQLNVIMMSALLWLLIACVLLALIKQLRVTLAFYPLMVVLLLAVTCAPVTNPIPIIALLEFILNDFKRLIFVIYFLALVLITVAAVCWQMRFTQKASTRVRKIFHALIVLVYIPGLIYECAFLYIATGVALAIFTVLELFRILNIPPLGAPLKSAFASFSDEKDAGILALTPFSLLISCSLPIWIHACPCKAIDDGDGTISITLLAGVLSTGIGDAAASIIGSKFGRIKWRNSSRSLEGSGAYVLSIIIVTFILAKFGLLTMTLSSFLLTLAATLLTAFAEANTDQIDNLVLPLIFYIVVNLG